MVEYDIAEVGGRLTISGGMPVRPEGFLVVDTEMWGMKV